MWLFKYRCYSLWAFPDLHHSPSTNQANTKYLKLSKHEKSEIWRSVNRYEHGIEISLIYNSFGSFKWKYLCRFKSKFHQMKFSNGFSELGKLVIKILSVPWKILKDLDLRSDTKLIDVQEKSAKYIYENSSIKYCDPESFITKSKWYKNKMLLMSSLLFISLHKYFQSWNHETLSQGLHINWTLHCIEFKKGTF